MRKSSGVLAGRDAQRGNVLEQVDQLQRDMRIVQEQIIPMRTVYEQDILVDHGSTLGLTDDDHLQYMHNDTARTVTAVHTFNPGSATAPFILGVNANGQLITGLNADLLDGVHLTSLVQTTRTVTAGAGLTGGGALSGNITINAAAADTSLTINADSLQVRRATNSGLVVSSGLALGTPTTLSHDTVNAVGSATHEHAITTSSNPGAAASILATDSSGFVRLEQLTINNNKFLYFKNAAGTGDAAYLYANTSDQLAMVSKKAGNALYFIVRNTADTGYLQAALSDSGAGALNLYFAADANITSVGSINIQPAAGSDMLVNLSTTGDFVVNTDDLVVDTSAARVGINTATPSASLHVVGNQYVSTALRVGTGLYVGSIGTAPDADDIHFDGNLKSVKSAVTHDVFGGKFLTTPLTSTSWDGDSFSTTAKTIIDLSAVFGVPADAKAVLVYVAVRDSASATSDTYMYLSPNATAYSGMPIQGHAVNDRYSHNTFIVPCSATGDIYYQINASGAGTFDVYLYIWGYWI